MKGIAAILLLTCTASAATLDTRAPCHVEPYSSCNNVGNYGCENNGGHSVRYIYTVTSNDHLLIRDTPDVLSPRRQRPSLGIRCQLPRPQQALRLRYGQVREIGRDGVSS